jgi:hypothetical protein
MMLLGILLTLVLLFFASILRLFLSRFVPRSFEQVIPFLRRDDPRTLAELLDVGLERQLCGVLPHPQMRAEQLNRMRLVRERIKCRTHNATVWQEWGDFELAKARTMGDADFKASADKLVAACAEFRIGASAVLMQLCLWQMRLLVFPISRIPHISGLRRVDDFDLMESYERIRHAAIDLADACGGDYRQKLAAVV